MLLGSYVTDLLPFNQGGSRRHKSFFNVENKIGRNVCPAQCNKINLVLSGSYFTFVRTRQAYVGHLHTLLKGEFNKNHNRKN